MDVIDDDSDENEDLVDFFLIDLQPSDLIARADMTTPQTYTGVSQIATIELSFQLECLPGFVGDGCVSSAIICDSSPCDNGGLCSPDATNGFTCTCVGDFTGRSCDMTIDDCLNVNCNNGTCVDGVGTFTCECEAGYTGQFCEQLVTVTPDHTPNVTSNSTPNSTPNSTTSSITSSTTPNSPTFTSISVVAGVIGGIVFALLITVINIVVLILVVKWKATARFKTEGNLYIHTLHGLSP